jgi:hypothetical protein
MWKPPVLDKTLPYALLGMTAVTGVVDAVSFLSLGHVFTANMTGSDTYGEGDPSANETNTYKGPAQL